MRTLIPSLIAVLSAVVVSGFAQDKAGRKAGTAAPNPNIDMDAYLKVANEAAEHRKDRRLTEDEFIRMAAEKGTIVLDARSKAMFDLSHVDGAVNLSFPDISIDSLKKTLPDNDARILIYCNNNVKNSVVAYAPKAYNASLNLSTYVSLYSYGYRNVYELGPVVDPKESKIKFVEAAAKGK